jgi:hypothetical protein
MNKIHAVRLAVWFLLELDKHPNDPPSPLEMSRSWGVRIDDCQLVLRRLLSSGILSSSGDGRALLALDLGSLTAFDLLSAIWDQEEELPEVRILGGADVARLPGFLNQARQEMRRHPWVHVNG